MYEFIINIHNHTRYSDGQATHRELARAAYEAGIHAVFVTDHNVFVRGIAGYHDFGNQRVMILVGEEIHDRQLHPQKNHLLVLGAGAELTQFAANTQNLINHVHQHGGLAYIAHPFEDALPLINETDITWEKWSVTGYTGLEVWNGLSELKSVVKNKLHGLLCVLFPGTIARGPNPKAMAKWDQLNAAGGRVLAIGGTDSHQLRMSLGPISRTIFPYEWHYQTINNHLLLPAEPSGDFAADERVVLDTMRSGRYFIGYDLPEPTTGFRFYGNAQGTVLQMGDSAALDAPITLQASLPGRCLARLFRDGTAVAEWHHQEKCAFHVAESGAYRLQAYIPYLGRQRTWIISNPIFIKPPSKR